MTFDLSIGERGFSLIETLVATSLLIAVAVSLAQLSRTRAVECPCPGLLGGIGARRREDGAVPKPVMGFRCHGAPLTDTSADLSVSPERPSGGVGLHTSPADALDRNVDGDRDFLDARASPRQRLIAAAQDAYIRRWSVARRRPIRQTVWSSRSGWSAAPPATLPAGGSAVGEARLVSIKARTTS